MSMTTRVAPIAVAGVAGILVGYLLAPNVGTVREDLAARFNEQTPLIQQLQASVASMESRIAAMPDAQALNASIGEQLAAAEGRLATQTETLMTQFGEETGGVPEEITTGFADLRTGVDEIRAEVETLATDVAALREAGAASQAAAPQEDEAGRLAEEIGSAGAVLLAGQGAIFGGNRVDLTELDVEAGTGVMTPEGAEPVDVSAGDTVELGANCTIRLAGIASNAAYLAPESCAEGAPAADGAQAPVSTAPATAPAGGEAQPQQATPPAAIEAQEGDEANQPPAGQAPAGEQQSGSDTPAQGAQAVPDQQPGQAEENAPNAGEPQGGQPQPVQ